MQRSIFLIAMLTLAACGQQASNHGAQTTTAGETTGGTPRGTTGGGSTGVAPEPAPTVPAVVSASQPALPAPPATSTASKISASGDVHFMGRFDATDANGPLMAWSNSTVVVRFTGPSLAVSIAPPAEQQTYQGTPVNNLYDVFVDEHPPVVLTLKQGQNAYPVSNDLGAGTHTAWLVKRSEAQVGADNFQGFEIGAAEKYLPPITPPAHRIEFIGDSITAGFGDEGAVATCQFAPDTENADASYAALTADALDAEFMNLSFAGKGMFRNRDPIGDPVRTLPYLYKLKMPQVTSTWDFTSWAPQVVVINLGTNDYKAPGTLDQQAFITAYEQFVTFVRGNYPQALIFCALGPELHTDQLTAARTAIQQVVTDVTAAGDAHVAFIEFPEDTGANGYGCQYHPNVITQKQMAQALQSAIHAKLGW